MVSVQVDGGAGGSGYASLVQDPAGPMAHFVGIDEDLIRLAAHAGYDLVAAGMIEVRGEDGVGVEQSIVDQLAAAGVDGDLVAMPGLDRRYEALLPQMADGGVAGSLIRDFGTVHSFLMNR